MDSRIVMQEDNAWCSGGESFDGERFIQMCKRLLLLVIISLGCVIGFVILHLGISLKWFNFDRQSDKSFTVVPANLGITWRPPNLSTLPEDEFGELVRYGRELVMHTASYLGPDGKVAKISNGLNCQNCHLAAGTKPYAANYSVVASSYPKFRKRSGTVEGFEKRVNDCIERSLNGSPLDEDGPEMKAMVAYLKWIGRNNSGKAENSGAGLVDITLLGRPADPARGHALYLQFCAQCHGEAGEGLKGDNDIEWKYPPLWGANSYNTGAGLYRISKFAAFIKANMPYGVTFENPLLTDEQSWDIAAYVNSMPRPHKEFPMDWPTLSWKPIDHPFGPYADSYSEREHKYGPFGQMQSKRRR